MKKMLSLFVFSVLLFSALFSFVACTGADACPTCRGKERYTCTLCDGEKERPCMLCDGKGKKTCYLCSGTGMRYSMGGYIVCPVSNSCSCIDGTVNCYVCDQDGTVDCPDCSTRK